MKKIIMASLMPVLLSAAFTSFAAEDTTTPNPVTVDGGKINFTGSIKASPCAVDNDTDGLTVRLGQVPTNRLAAKGDTSSAVPFVIKLIGCKLASTDKDDPTKAANYTAASVTFKGTTTGDDSTLALQAAPDGAGDTANTARNVGVQILQNGKSLKVDGSTASAAQKITDGYNEIPFSAEYVATANDVVAGSANSSIEFLMNYQ